MRWIIAAILLVIVIVFFFGDAVGLFAKAPSSEISPGEVKGWQDWYESGLPTELPALPVPVVPKEPVQLSFIERLQQRFKEVVG